MERDALYILFRNSDSLNKYSPICHVAKMPKSGWERLFTKLYSLNLKSLPDMDKLNHGQYEIYEGDAITVEYATKQKYRLYQYQIPYHFQGAWKEARQMEEIAKLLEYEFDFKRLRSPVEK